MTTPKTALITGASSGLGRGLALHCASKGVKVYAAARRTDQLESLKKEAQGEVIPFTLDVSDGDATFEAVKKLDADCGGLDLVIANAGTADATSGKRVDWARVKRILDVNVTGAAATICGALPGMVERKRGHLVGVSSISAIVTPMRLSAYGASKAFLTHYLDGIRLDVEPLGLKVTVIQPGYIKTDLTAARKPETMPFLMELDDAVAEITGAIDRGAREHTFPWQVGTFLKSVAALPGPLQSAAMKRFG
jgi:NADP-dependent 3-hydroxy acid dehydrogenase YdfG